MNTGVPYCKYVENNALNRVLILSDNYRLSLPTGILGRSAGLITLMP